MKKVIASLVAAAVFCTGAIGLAACSTADEVSTIVVGITDYDPLDYRDGDDNWTGFDAELATKVFSELGYKVVFSEIDWETKIITLNAGTIDVIWNGMTITDDLAENLALSDAYLTNSQYGLVKPENKEAYSSAADLAGKTVAVEGGSAADDLVAGVECTVRKCTNQNAAVLEAASGTSDIAIVDYLMASTLTRAGSTYAGKLVAVSLGFEKEEFAVGFRKGDTELRDKVNAKLKELKDSGYTLELAKKYSLQDAIK